ncbi:MAG: transglutaminase family protein [Pirellulales bacterium]
MSLELFPTHRLTWSRDVFGNSIALAEFLEPADRLEVRSQVVVQRLPLYAGEEPHARGKVPFPVVYDPLESIVASAYQTLSYPDDGEAVRTWLDEQIPPAARSNPETIDAERIIEQLGLAVKEHVKYLRRTEKGVQSPAQTLELGTGSCRDMAVLMMDAARVLGLSARFASGYLDCAASHVGRASTHAWAEIYLPLIGWTGYDATIGEPTSLKHVVTGVSNHPRGVMPISGMFHGEASDYIDLTVSVKTEQITPTPSPSSLPANPQVCPTPAS